MKRLGVVSILILLLVGLSAQSSTLSIWLFDGSSSIAKLGGPNKAWTARIYSQDDGAGNGEFMTLSKGVNGNARVATNANGTGTTRGVDIGFGSSAVALTIDGGGVAIAGTTPFILGTVAFAALGTPANGRLYYCSDCTIANPCAGAGTGALAKRINGTWICN